MAINKKANKTKDEIPTIKIHSTRMGMDFATVIGLILVMSLISLAILIGGSNANFINAPAIMIVILGTFFVTTMSFSMAEMGNAGKVIWNTFSSRKYSGRVMAKQLLDLAVLARKKGPLALSQVEKELKKDKFLFNSMQMVTDGYSPEDIEEIIKNQNDALTERHIRSSDILRRGAEIAPAMGLIGTLVGLVQMLADLDDPDKIGPAMAIALLTTFYGAILGIVILTPMAAKLERNSQDEIMIRNLILTSVKSISLQDNPRRLEAILNSILPPKDKIKYFD